MHKLNRNPNQPACLAANAGQPYGVLRTADKDQIRADLLTMQSKRCAYCERRTGDGRDDGHIEHFRSQATHPHLQTDWNNMFWSCKDEKSCGKHKDKCNVVGSTGKCRPFNADHVIDPCVDDPEEFMWFISNGTISPREGLSVENLHRYSETMRIFQLNESPLLRKSREDAVRPYIRALDALRVAGPEVFRAYIKGELAMLDSTPFATAVRHFFESNL